MELIAHHMHRAQSIVLKAVWLVASIGTLTIGAGLVSGCGNHVAAAHSGTAPAMKVSVVKAEQSDIPVTGEWVGTLDGYVNAQIQPQANGYLVRQNYHEGSQVQKGQVLFEIDPRPFEAALDQAQGQLGKPRPSLASPKSM